MAEFSIDTKEFKQFSDTLGKLHRSAMPNAVRGTLNSAGFDVKQNTLLKITDRKFEERKKNFFKSNSKVDTAKGWDIGAMATTVGMKGSGNLAVKDLEQQEIGGKIGGRAFIPMNPSRTGKSHAKLVQKKNRLKGLQGIVNSKDQKGNRPGSRIIQAAVKAGSGGHILSENGTLFRVDNLRKKPFKFTALYSYRKGRVVTVKATHFMRYSASISAKKFPEFFIKEANRQIAKYIR